MTHIKNIESEDDILKKSEVLTSSLPKMEAELERVSAIFEKEEAKEEKKKKRKIKVQAFKYLLFTASAGLIEFISYTILMEALPIDSTHTVWFFTENSTLYFVSTAISLTLSILWNFTINRKFTFKSDGNVPRAMFLAFLFYVPFFPFKLWANSFLPGSLAVHPLIIEIITMLLNGVLEFCWQKFIIYRNEEDSALEKYKVGEIGDFGEIGIADIEFNGEEILHMLRAGLDINAMDYKQMKKWLKDQ